ncbi:DNA gyrase subunit A [Candidatus Woesearchaeota archaeon]|nr:DNA gyrase subunit A [Candidatus Woesearchaeota archaeon]
MAKNSPKSVENSNEKLVPQVIEAEMKTSYLNYAMSVIVGRALPDVRDGLKPVHRRILFAMNEMSMFSNKPFKKSARIVGEVLGKYHPHGDTAVYDSIVRMVQTFSLRYPLIQGQGNFGSVDGDNAAAMRYTEARLAKIANEMLQDIDKETVAMTPNFDESLKEPTVLPAKIPNLLINGSSGIAVGMATNMPPHNLSEVCDGTIHLIDNPHASVNDLMEHVQGPDFPTGAEIAGRNGIISAYTTGRGKVTVKATHKIEDYKNKKRIIIDQIPYMVNKSALIQEIVEGVKGKKIEGISDIRDESDRQGIRVVIELKKDLNIDVVLNQLYKHTRCRVTFGILNIALVDGEPKVLNLKQIIEHYIKHRKNIVKKRTKYDLKKAEERAHILEGLLIALLKISAVIALIRKSKTVADAEKSLVKGYKLTIAQAKAILEMRLSKLASLEQQKTKDEHKELLVKIKKLKEILASEEKIKVIIKDELKELKEKYADARKTKILDVHDEDLDIEDLIEKEDMVVTISHHGYIKRLPINTYREQRRGGKGVIAAQTKEEDFIEHLYIANTHAYMLFFTNIGKVHWLKVYRLPEGSRQAKGRPIVNLLELEEGETVNAFIPVKEFDDSHHLLFSTKNGVAKKTLLSAYSRPRRGGIISINLRDDDQLINVVKTDGNDQIIIATKNGMAVKFHEKDTRPMGRASTGVRGVRLKKDDEVIGMVKADDEDTILTVTENGFGKRTKIADYRLTRRGGVGVKNIICSERNGQVVGIRSVIDEDGLMFISQNGIIIRTRADQISTIGRATQGVRLMRLKGDDDRVVAVAKIISDDNENGKDVEEQAEN